MGKISLLVSREEMLYRAHNILQEREYQIEEIKVIQTKDTIVEARNTIANGTTIIIARGLQASLIKQYTDIPVVEIVLTAQEMALLIVKAKQILKKERPVIAVVGFKNMFCDMSYFEDIYEIELRTYYAESGNQLKECAAEAVEDKADLVIGGDTAVETATQAGIPSLFLSITEDSLRNAFSMAVSMDYAMSVEKKNAAQIETLLDYSFDGVINLDAAGNIKGMNTFMQHLMEKPEQDYLDIPITDVFEDITAEDLELVRDNGRERSLFIQVNHVAMLAVLAPVLLDGRTDGIIMSCHKIKREKGLKEARKPETKKFAVDGDFRDILQHSLPMKQCLRLAKLFSLSERPLAIAGEVGTEKLLLAQAIHNNSSRKEGSFMLFDCERGDQENQILKLFGEKGIAVQAHEGTLVLQNPERLSSAVQTLLFQMIREKILPGREGADKRYLNVRIIFIAGSSLKELMKKNLMIEDLYYLLSGFELMVPPLRNRPEDLVIKIETSLKQFNEYYGRYHVLTKGAKQILQDYSWNGNHLQIESFCERLVLTADKRSVDEVIVRELLTKIFPVDTRPVKEDNQLYERPEESDREKRIKQMLVKYDGNREKTANALGISKATLWRYMKKYEMK